MAISDCNLRDMQLEGYPFTWEKGKGTTNWVEVRLDRAMTSDEWNVLFPSARLINLEISSSDHCPLLLDPMGRPYVGGGRKFRFENAWLREPMCGQIVRDCWVMNEEASFQQKIRLCGEVLEEWGKEVTGSFTRRIQRANKIMKRLKGRRAEGCGLD